MIGLPIHDASGALIAGGSGSRLGGYPKGLLRFDGVPIAERTARLFGSLFADSMLVTNNPAPYEQVPLRKIPDFISGRGAPGGLHAALRASRTEWIFAAACDMPRLDAAGILFLA